jgi:hypothetical protein
MATKESMLREVLGNRKVQIVEESLEGALQGTGVRKVAEHDGIMLWAEIFDGRAVGYRAFDQNGTELPVLVIYVPLSRDRGPVEGMTLWSSASDGGTPSPRPKPCPFVCAATGDGGRICWPECPQ